MNDTPPANVHLKLVKDDGVSKSINPIRYQSIAGGQLLPRDLILLKQWEQCHMSY